MMAYTPKEMIQFNAALSRGRQFYIKKLASVLAQQPSRKGHPGGWRRGRAMALSDLLVTMLYGDLTNPSASAVRDKACELINDSLTRVARIKERLGHDD